MAFANCFRGPPNFNYYDLSKIYTPVAFIFRHPFFINCKTADKEKYTITPALVPFSISKGSNFETTVQVKNIGTEKLLIISEIATACGCVVGTLKDSSVLPNDSVPLKIVFTPNPTDTGKMFRFISLRTNGTPPISSVELRGVVH